MAGCLSTSLLAHGKQKKWIANSGDEYLEIAKMLFSNGPRSKNERIELRQEMQNSPVGNPKRLTQELESLYHRLKQNVGEPSR